MFSEIMPQISKLPKFLPFQRKEPEYIQEDPARHRKNDAIFLVRQTNQSRLLTIEALNRSAESLSGYPGPSLLGRDFRTILPRRFSEYLTESLEFSEGAPELDSVLHKSRDFSLMTRDGVEVDIRPRVVRTVSSPRNFMFEVIFKDNSLHNALKESRNKYSVNLKGHEILDRKSGLPSRESTEKDLELISFYSSKNGEHSTFAAISINNIFDIRLSSGVSETWKVLQAAAAACQKKMREEDSISQIDRDKLGVILLGTPTQNAPLVLNRLQWALTSSQFESRHDGSGFPRSLEISIAYTDIDPQTPPHRIISKCEETIQAIKKSGGKKIVLSE